jgi:iron complex outermembrane receptor protein
MRTCLRVFLALGLASLGIGFGTLPASAQTSANGTYDFNIPPGALEPALRKLAQDNNLQILFAPEDVKDVSTGGVKGRFSPLKAVEELVKGTGLSVSTNGNGVFAIKPAGPTKERNPPGVVRQEGVIVTAQKREQVAHDVPISIVALTGEDLQRRRITTVDELPAAVPGLNIQTAGGYQRRISLRGASDLYGNSSLVGMYLDEATATLGISNQLDLQTYDLARIEVLRGPQGTLYGEGSVGGTIRFITNDPQLDRFAAAGELAASATDSGTPSQRVQAMVNMPLSDQFALRIAGTFDHQGGWIDQPAIDKTNINDQKLKDVRIKALWQPTADFTANAMAVVHRNKSAPAIGEDANGNYTQAFGQPTSPTFNDDYEIYNATLSYDMSAMRALSTTTYAKQDKEGHNLGFIYDILGPGQPLGDVLQVSTLAKNDVFTQEFRLTSTGKSSLQWTLGAIYKDADLQIGVPQFYLGFPASLPANLPTRIRSTGPNTTRSKSWAAFGDANYDLGQGFSLGAGVRYFEDRQHFTSVTGTTTTVQSGTFDSLNPRVYGQYKVSEDVNVYASASKGFRSGGFNGAGQATYDPERVWTYEFGTKVWLQRGLLSADAAVYYSDYKNYQIVSVTPTTATTENAGNARLKGVELAVTWHPLKEWTVTFSGDYIDAKFYEINAALSPHFVGDRVDLVPNYTVTASFQRDFSWAGRAGFARLDYSRQGHSTYRDLTSGPWVFSESDIIDMLNANVGLQWNSRLSVNLFAQNLLNDRGYVDPLSAIAGAARARPRTIGAGVSVAF